MSVRLNVRSRIMGNYKKYRAEFKQEVLAMVAAGERTVSQARIALLIAIAGKHHVSR